MVIEYDGGNYCGWQKQRRGLSIQGVMEKAIRTITGETVTLLASGRTDAGVHAYGQVANFRCTSRLPEQKLFWGINSVLPPDIVIKELSEAPAAFHARRDATGKEYVYCIHNGTTRCALSRAFVWQVFEKLAVNEMQKAAQFLIGRHDFRSFCSTHTNILDFEREVRSISITQENALIKISITADGFLRHMVRTIVGTLVDVGKGRIQTEAIKEILEAKNRRHKGKTAPAQGLFLLRVDY